MTPPDALPVTTSAAHGAGPRSAAVWLKRLGPLLGLLLVFGLFSALRPQTFPTPNNVELMLLQTAVVITASLGMTMVIVTGGIDLSVGSKVAVCSVLVAVLLKAGHGPTVAAAGGVACGVVLGLLTGGLITGLRLQPFIVTLGLWSAVRGLAIGLADKGTVSTKGENWLQYLLLSRSPLTEYTVVAPGLLVTLALALAVAGTLRYTRFGRHLFAVGSNEQTARLCGIHVGRTKVAAYAVAGALAGCAGVLQYAYVTVGDPTTATGLELDVIAAVVIGGASLSGGVGSVAGTVVGALLMTAVANGCTKLGLENWVQMTVTGVIIVAAAAVDRLRQRVR
ncbi:MAG TPA: ABC transporter permease [Humisphaera sp.]